MRSDRSNRSKGRTVSTETNQSIRPIDQTACDFLPKQIQMRFKSWPYQKADNNFTLDKKKGETSKSGSCEDQKSAGKTAVHRKKRKRRILLVDQRNANF